VAGPASSAQQGVVGSVLAAVGTALPETLIPVVALIFFGQQHGAEVGIGAIAGAPFMLSTLTFGICGITCLLLARSGKREPGLEIKKGVIKRDLRFFIAAYALALGCSFLPTTGLWRPAAAILLVLIYPFYLFKSFSHEGEVGEEPERLYLDKLTKIGSDKLRLIVPQIVLGLIGITSGAYFFVQGIQNLSDDFHIPRWCSRL
jgi:Ca2+/Na+ antiporter